MWLVGVWESRGWWVCRSYVVGGCVGVTWLVGVWESRGWWVCGSYVVGGCVGVTWLVGVWESRGWWVCGSYVVGGCVKVLLGGVGLWRGFEGFFLVGEYDGGGFERLLWWNGILELAGRNKVTKGSTAEETSQ